MFCTMLLAVGTLAIMAVMPKPALAQCGVTVQMAKSCDTPKFVGDKVDCTITLTNKDTCNNTYRVNSGSDVIHASGGDVTDSSLPISAVSGTTTCTVAGSLPCDLSVNASVTFHDNNYTIVAGDVGALDDTGTVNMTDLCDSNNSGCSSTAVNEQAPASTTVETCGVTLDKQVSCDGGTTWKDVTGIDDSDPSTPPSGPECSGINAFDGTPATDIKVRYVITNTGTVDLENCSANESNGLIIGATSGTVIIPGVNTDFNTTDTSTQTTDPFTKACSTELAAGEADTAMVTCGCAGTNGAKQVSASDSADFACNSPGLTVVKSCSPASGGVNSFTIDVSNTGDLDLTNCNVTDAYQANDTCTNVDLVNTVDATNSLSPAGNGNYSISAGNSLPQFSGSISGLSADACNQATVTCNVGDSSETITATSQDTCEVALGCDTRTPGFWGTHPAITQAVINDSGGSIESCGFDINSTVAADSCSATEDICSVGKDSNTLGIDPSDMQLVRQCMAAEINFAASAQDGGSCSDTLPGVAFTLEDCCGTAGVCATGGTPVNGATVAACISALDAFNNLETTIDGSKYLTSPGAADSSECQASNGDGIVNTGPCGGGRVYTTKTTGKNAPTNNGKKH